MTSARTRAGQPSPILGLATSTMEKAVMVCAILAQPPNTTPPYSDCLQGREGGSDRESDECCGQLSRRKPVGFGRWWEVWGAAHGAAAYLFTFCQKQTRKVPTSLDIMGTLIMLSNGFPNAAHQMPQPFNKI